MPTRPQNDAGTRIDPAPSVPCDTAHMPAARAAAAPPLEPPGVRSVSQGLRQIPLSSDEVMLVQNSGTLVLPRMINPARFHRRTIESSALATLSARALDEWLVTMPPT